MTGKGLLRERLRNGLSIRSSLTASYTAEQLLRFCAHSVSIIVTNTLCDCSRLGLFYRGTRPGHLTRSLFITAYLD